LEAIRLRYRLLKLCGGMHLIGIRDHLIVCIWVHWLGLIRRQDIFVIASFVEVHVV